MAYRKIEVDGQEYQYTIGKSFVKIKGFEAVPKHVIGVPRYDEYSNSDEPIGFTVTPALVQQYIKACI